MGAPNETRVTVPVLQRMKRDGRPIAMITAYDAQVARLVDQAGVDIILVGDSLGMVFQGQANTLAVTLEEIIYHTRAVVRGAVRAHVVADMPFMTYQSSVDEGIRNAGRLLKEAGAHAVKLEGGERHAELVKRATDVGIPVMGHIGLTPQSLHAMGGYKVQGKKPDEAKQLLSDGLALEAAGAYAVVLEGVPKEVAASITAALSIPTIGIGAGPHCDGQVLVVNDVLGLDENFAPKFVKRYDNLAERVQRAVGQYVKEVRDGLFPTEAHSFSRSSRGEDAGTPKRPPIRAPELDDDSDLADPIPLYPGVKRK